MDRETRRPLANTQEFIALWNTAREEHLVGQVVPLLPQLCGGSFKVNAEGAERLARHLVRALHLASLPEAGVHAAISYLAEVVQEEQEQNPS